MPLLCLLSIVANNLICISWLNYDVERSVFAYAFQRYIALTSKMYGSSVIRVFVLQPQSPLGYPQRSSLLPPYIDPSRAGSHKPYLKSCPNLVSILGWLQPFRSYCPCPCRSHFGALSLCSRDALIFPLSFSFSLSTADGASCLLSSPTYCSFVAATLPPLCRLQRRGSKMAAPLDWEREREREGESLL